jgi:hypothetical protein
LTQWDFEKFTSTLFFQKQPRELRSSSLNMAALRVV